MLGWVDCKQLSLKVRRMNLRRGKENIPQAENMTTWDCVWRVGGGCPGVRVEADIAR